MFGLPAWAWKFIGLAVVALTIMGCGARLAAIWYAPQVTHLKAVVTAGKVAAKVSHQAQAQLTASNGRAEATAQVELKRQATVIHKKVHVHVTPHQDQARAAGCITWGMLRLHDAAVDGADPGDLGSPVGEPDDACSPVTPSVFVGVIADNYAAARANAEQLNALEADIQARGAAVVGSASPPVTAPALTP